MVAAYASRTTAVAAPDISAIRVHYQVAWSARATELDSGWRNRFSGTGAPVRTSARCQEGEEPSAHRKRSDAESADRVRATP